MLHDMNLDSYFSNQICATTMPEFMRATHLTSLKHVTNAAKAAPSAVII